MESIQIFLENTCSILNFLCLLGPMPASLKAVRTKNVDTLPLMYLLMNTTNNIMWSAYTFHLNMHSLLLVFLIGVLIFMFYMITYFYAKNQLKIALFGIIMMLLLFYIALYVLSLPLIGIICSILNTVSYLTYLEPLCKALVHRSTKYLNFPLLTLALLTASAFVILGLFLMDPNYFIPCIVGVILVSLQFIIALWVNKYIKDSCIIIAFMLTVKRILYRGKTVEGGTMEEKRSLKNNKSNDDQWKMSRASIVKLNKREAIDYGYEDVEIEIPEIDLDEILTKYKNFPATASQSSINSP